METTSEGAPKSVQNNGVRPNHNTSPVTRAQYPNRNATANAVLIQETENTELTDEDDEHQRRIMSSLQYFCTDRFINVAKQVHPSIMMPTAMEDNVHILDEPPPHLSSVQSDVSTLHSSDFNQLDFPVELQKNNSEHPFTYSERAVSCLSGFVWVTICCLIYILQYSLCMDPGEFSQLPTSEDFYGSNTHLVFQYSGEANQLFPVRETQNKFSMSLCPEDT